MQSSVALHTIFLYVQTVRRNIIVYTIYFILLLQITAMYLSTAAKFRGYATTINIIVKSTPY